MDVPASPDERPELHEFWGSFQVWLELRQRRGQRRRGRRRHPFSPSP